MFEPAKLARVQDLLARKINDITDYPNPDLAVEVDISRPQTDRLSIYAVLQVPEIWTFDGETVTIRQLGAAGVYVDTGRSNWIPVTARRCDSLAGCRRHHRPGRMGGSPAGMGRVAGLTGSPWPNCCPGCSLPRITMP